MPKVLTTTLTRYHIDSVVFQFDAVGEVAAVTANLSRFKQDDTRYDQTSVILTPLISDQAKQAIQTRLTALIAAYKQQEDVD